MIRVVLHTNIIVSALLQPLGPPAQILVLAIGGSIQMCISGSIYAEYEEVISRPRFQRAYWTSSSVKRKSSQRKSTPVTSLFIV
jgi:putative PIN family toxin of toxin-antitoxin system